MYSRLFHDFKARPTADMPVKKKLKIGQYAY